METFLSFPSFVCCLSLLLSIFQVVYEKIPQIGKLFYGSIKKGLRATKYTFEERFFFRRGELLRKK